jgi:tRNA-dihydrouridine synthase
MSFSDATFLDYAADVKKRVAVPIIAVGRLGDPTIAERAVTQGKADFIALGRTLIAEPQWVNKVRRGEPIRRCLSCNTCINEMRGGARIGCVVNAVAGRETSFAAPQIPQERRIAVIGAGPAGLTYASLVAPATTSPCSKKKRKRAARSNTRPRRHCFRKSIPRRAALPAISTISPPLAVPKACNFASARMRLPHPSCWRDSIPSL